MSTNAWALPQRQVELPKSKRLYVADEQDAQTIKDFDNEPKVELYRELNDETDYAVTNADGSITRVSECVTINGTQWWLVPGINYVPKSVYEFVMQSPHQGALLPTPALNQKYLGNLSR